ncbi:MAG: ABC transporter ATP-binding protein [Anaerolineae bacterium]|jgi:ABC-2 type transport system ATP-binding protein|nr:ATP-binding cassette domain-containing protein [Chloroflexota bacterium]
MQALALEVEDLFKSFGDVQAVRGVSFVVGHGEIFGLLGSNGAGKTTTIRMVLDLIQPDSGRIAVLGAPFGEATKARVGYLPEERGLYRDMKLWDVLVYLGQLKGLSAALARQRTEHYLRMVELWEARNLKVEALSRGMGQKAQFVAAAQHEPDLVIIDEPFSGLDPVNTAVIRSLIYSMRDRGAAVIMSTHQMHQVEEMCQRILLIDRGRPVLYGDLDEIRERFSSNAVEVALSGALGEVPGVLRSEQREDVYRLYLAEGTTPEALLRYLVSAPGVEVHRFERVRTSLDEIFVQTVGHRAEGTSEGEVAA